MSLLIPSDQYKRIKIKNEHKPPYTIDIGCGIKCVSGAIGIDVHDNGQEIRWNVLEGIPLPNDSVKEVHMYHFLEHVEYYALDALFRDIRRVCLPKSLIHIRVPHKQHPDAYSAPHVSFWDEKAIEGFTNGFINSRQERCSLFRVEWMKTKDNGRLLCCRIEVLR